MKTRVLLVDDQRLLRESLRMVLAALPDLDVVGEAEDGRAAVELAVKLRPHVVVMDVAMPMLNGIEATRQIKAANPAVRVLALSGSSERRWVAEILRAGASGFLLKGAALDELSRAIRAVVREGAYLSPSVASEVLFDYVRRLDATADPLFTTLTAREREVLQALAEGVGTKRLASLLRVSPKTIETHRANLMRKLGLKTTADLVKFAIRSGVTSVGG